MPGGIWVRLFFWMCVIVGDGAGGSVPAELDEKSPEELKRIRPGCCAIKNCY
jgi:hypothetical protein